MGQILRRRTGCLDIDLGKQQTIFMAHIYMRFEFGADEEKAQAACHKLDGWRQAFRLDKRVQYKIDRQESAASGSGEKEEKAEPPEKTAKEVKTTKTSAAEKSKAKAKSKEPEKEPARTTPASNGRVSLVVRLYFSSHEKLSEQRWMERIPNEEPFKSASPKIIRKEDLDFEEVDQEFESRERAEHRNAATRM
jgi:hypothetical protein